MVYAFQETEKRWDVFQREAVGPVGKRFFRPGMHLDEDTGYPYCDSGASERLDEPAIASR